MVQSSFFRIVIFRFIKYLFLVGFFLFLFTSQGYAYLALINKSSISVQDYQKYINVKKFIARQKTIDRLAQVENKKKTDLFNEFVDQKLILIEAKKKGYHSKNKHVLERYNKTKDRWLYGLYSALNGSPVDQKKNEASVIKFYNSLPQSKKKKYQDLQPQEKQQLIQMVTLKNQNEAFLKKLEKKYRVKRYDPEANVVAKIENSKVNRSEVEKLFLKQLGDIGIAPETLKEKDLEGYKKAKRETLERVIFEKLVILDMKRTGFKKKKLTINSLAFYKEKIILNEFVSREIAKNTSVSEQELDQAFQALSKSYPQIQRMLPSEQEKFLRNAIIQQKLPEILNQYLIDKKEEIVIKKNRQKLNQIK